MPLVHMAVVVYDHVFSSPIPDLGQSLSESLSHCHFRILTQRVTFETWDPSDIQSEWCLDKKGKKIKRQKDKKKLKDKETKEPNNKMTNRQKEKTQRPKRVSHSCDILSTSGNTVDWKVDDGLSDVSFFQMFQCAFLATLVALHFTPVSQSVAGQSLE